MEESWRGWLIGLVVVLSIGGWFWWKSENPTLVDGDYRCEGRTSHPDGSSSAIDGDASVVGGKIQIGQTGADIAMDRQVMSWGEVENSSTTQFLVRLTPASDIASEIPDPFWMTCTLQ